MGLKIGIIGLANVGKSTLFNALLGRQAALTAPYPFATVEPNVGVAEVVDERLIKLRDCLFPIQKGIGKTVEQYNGKTVVSKSVTGKPAADITDLPAYRATDYRPTASPLHCSTGQPPVVFSTVTFVDIAGLVKGAAQGQGLGNQFLSHIRDVDLILHVLRDFDEGIPRAADSKNPEYDAEIVKTELELKDLELKEKNPQYGDYLSKKPVIYAVNVDEKKLGETPAVRSPLPWSTSTRRGVATAGFGRSNDILPPSSKMSGSSEKPVIYAVNVGEERLAQLALLGGGGGETRIARRQTSGVTDDRRQTIDDTSVATATDKPIFYFSAKLEEEISKMPKNEQKEYLKIYGLEKSCLDRIISACFQALGLISFFTAGPKEVRAWPTRRDSPAPAAAGVIHSDFEKLFIRAEVIGWEKLAEAGSWQKAKERGWVRTEGKEYLIQDGDVCNFLIGK